MTEADHGGIHDIARPDPLLLRLYLLRAAITGPLFPFIFLPLYCKYRTLRYRFDDEGVMMAWGLLWRREIFLTYARVQDIHLSRGVLERWLGLATINIQTAAGSASAEMALVGLAGYEAVRDFLYSKMRGARFGADEPQRPVEAIAVGEAEAPEDDVTVLLTDIRDELRAVRAELERREA